MVQPKILFRTQSVWWSSVLFALAFFCPLRTASQIRTEASNRAIAANYETLPTVEESDSTLSQRQPASAKLARRSKAAQRRALGPQETGEAIALDTSHAALEAIRALPRDSSARIAQFTYVRKDKPVVDGTYHKNHPLFLSVPSIVKYQSVLDSSKWVYRLHRTIGEYDTYIPTDIPLDEYTSLRLKQAVRVNWESMAQFYQLQAEKKTTLGDLLGKITKIEVPVPKNPIFSIFGQNIIRMIINGAVNIHAGFRNIKSDLFSANPLGQSQNIPDFRQEIQVNVKGEIGDKLKIDADWNTQRTFEYENQLHVKYQGYEDEIVQTVEAGNVSLPTNSAFFGGGQALFGIKAQFQMGPLHLTTVATQKKGEIKALSLSGGGQANAFEKRAADYSKSHYFIDTSYIGLYEKVFQTLPVYDEKMQRMRIRQIEVWISTKTETDQNKYRNVVALMDQAAVEGLTATNNPDSLRIGALTRTPVPGQIEDGHFIKLDPTEYDYNDYAGIISLRSQPQDDQVIAVAYGVSNFDNTIRLIGQSSQTPRDNSLNLVMKLVRPSQLGPQLQPAWKLMLKNHYFLGGTGIDKSSFEFHIDYQLPGQTAMQEVTPQNIGILEMLGLDQFTGADNSVKGPDKMFDYDQRITVDEQRGEVIFPTVEPFDSLSIYNFAIKHSGVDASLAQAYADSFAYRAIYNKLYVDAVNDPKNLFYLRGAVKTTQKATYSLGFNVVEGSVEVIVNGQRATPNVDYTVDYISGQVIIKNPAFLTPGTDVQIKYESNDMFQLASKSLLGARGEFSLGKNTSLGFTIMNYSQQSLSDKIRLGEEPISNTIMGIDGGTTIDAPWLTNLLDYIPGLKSITSSQISLRGEVAYMVPNPNTRTSPISSDGAKGVAYIDDFEGTRQFIPLGISYSGWNDASAPWYIKDIDSSYIPSIATDGREYIPASENLYAAGISADTAKMNYKARACWFNVFPSDVLIPTIWGTRKSFAAGEGQVMSLDFYFRPGVRGAFNYSMNLESTIGVNKDPIDELHRKAWAGCQRILATTSTNLVEQNIAFVELWINIVSGQDDLTKLNIDLGYINEDVIPNGSLNTEDGLDNPNHTPRGILNPDYDWGLDTLNNAKERNTYWNFWHQYQTGSGTYVYEADPSGDDWKRPPIGNNQSLNVDIAKQYDGMNGTDENHDSEEGRYPNTEDLNRNGKVDLLNAYYEYEIPLDTNSIAFKKLVTGTGLNNWYQIRIPLNDYKRKIGEATFTNVEGVRLWITGAKQPTLFRIVEFNLVGNQWEKRVKTDSSFEVSVVNIEDNPFYTTPPGVSQQRDLTRPDQNILGNEQSLNLIVDSLHDGQSKEVVKYFVGRSLDMFNYRTLKMFVHGEEGIDAAKGYREFKYQDTSNYDAEMFIRFGANISNYYEYRAPVLPGWRGNDVNIKFADLTAIKALAFDDANFSPRISVPGGPSGATYQICGSPSLNKIEFISIGIKNPEKKGPVTPRSVGEDSTITGELWVNELRLTDVDDTRGWAYKFDTNIKLADVGNISFYLSERDPFFHGLEDRFGSHNTSRSWGISASFAFDRLLPESWRGTILDVNYSHSETMDKPLYMPGQDVLVEKAAARVASDTSTSSKRQYKNANDVRLQSENLGVSDSYSMPSIRINIPLNTWLITETINKILLGYSYTESHNRNPSTEYSEAWSWSASFRYGTQFNKDNYVSPFSIFGDFFLLRPWKDFKVFFTPRSLNFGATLNRNQTKSKARTLTAVPSINRYLTSTRAMDFNWQFFEGGLLDLGIGYGVNISSTLQHLETDRMGNLRPWRSFYDILNEMFLSDRLINFGIDQNYSQGIGFNMRLATPRVLMLDKIFTPSARYNVNYNWSNNISAGDLGRGASWSSSPSFTLNVNLTPITETLWPATTTSEVDTGVQRSSNPLKHLGLITRILFKYTFFDFNNFSFNFSQSNSSHNNSVRGSTGFANIFARVPFFQSSLVENGPSLLYQLGFITDPNGRLVLKTKGTFPFITGYTVPGLRASIPNSTTNNIVDDYSQNNQISIHTSRPLWEGASLQLDWKVGWSYNENKNGSGDAFGVVTPGSRTVSGGVERSFISLPPVVKFLKTNMEEVNKKFEEYKKGQAGS